MSDVTFVASGGLGTLLALTEEFGEAGGCLYLAPVSDAVSSVVKLLNLDQFLAIIPRTRMSAWCEVGEARRAPAAAACA